MKSTQKSEKNPYEDLAIAELEGHTVGKDEEKLTLLPSSKAWKG